MRSSKPRIRKEFMDSPDEPQKGKYHGTIYTGDKTWALQSRGRACPTLVEVNRNAGTASRPPTAERLSKDWGPSLTLTSALM